MPELIHYDPGQNIRYTVDWAPDGNALVKMEQDCSPVVERAAKARAEGWYDRGIKENWWHIADIPPAIWLEIKQKYNCDMFTADENEWRRFLQIIERDYPKLKTTDKRIA